MLGPKQEAQSALFYEFSIEDHVPQDHLLRSIEVSEGQRAIIARAATLSVWLEDQETKLAKWRGIRRRPLHDSHKHPAPPAGRLRAEA